MVIGSHVTERLEQKVRGISQAFLEYKQLKLLKNPIKGIYILLFLLMTLIVVFSFTWFGLHLARGITGPIEQLAEGTREVAAGNLAYKVQTRGDDEIGTLVESFNRMTDDLGQSKRQLEEAYLDLQDKHTELEDRRRYIETVLEAITTGVVSFDSLGRVTTINRAAARMFGIAEAASVGRLLEEVFSGPEGRDIVTLVQRARRPRAASAAVRAAPAPRRRRRCRCWPPPPRCAARTASTPARWWCSTISPSCSRPSGWPPGARWPSASPTRSRIRSRRSSSRPSGCGGGWAGAIAEEQRLVAECTETIIQEVDGLRRLVDEFSRFARMPAFVPKPTDVRPAGRERGQPLSRLASRAHAHHPPRRRTCRCSRSIPTTSSGRC